MNYGKNEVAKKLQRSSSKAQKVASKLVLWLVKLVLVLFTVGIILSVSLGYGIFKGIIDAAPEIDVASIEPSGYATMVYDSKANLTETLVKSGSNRLEATYEELPQCLIDAFVAIEDSRFWSHHGVDLRSMIRAAVGILTNNPAGGGSTLTQQLAKNELFTQEKQMARKAAEMFAARDIEDYYSKQQIFEMYAGSCYFGNQWSGVAQAAQGYFGKPTRELTRAECVVLAGLPNAPSVYAANGELARRRALVVVERMERAKKLTHTQALELRDEVSALPLW